MPVHCIAVDWSIHQAKLRQVREQVFLGELGIARDVEFDGLDEQAAHFIALNEAGLPLGTARLLASGQISRVAVLPEHRRRGIGRQLLSTVAEHATRVGLGRVFLYVQGQVVPFFRTAGFRPTSVESLDTDSPDVEMELALPIAFDAPQRTVPLSFANRDATVDDSRPYRLVQFNTERDCRTAAGNLLAGARRTVMLLSASLDHRVFGSDACLASISAFARRSRHTQFLILVEDAKAIAAGAHPLLELARRLPSKVVIRRLPDDREPQKSNFMVVDDEAVWMLPDCSVYSGWANEHDRVEARRLSDEFMWLFGRSSEDPELRLLSL
jgi:predicted GNAT family N-acyltransferase